MSELQKKRDQLAVMSVLLSLEMFSRYEHENRALHGEQRAEKAWLVARSALVSVWLSQILGLEDLAERYDRYDITTDDLIEALIDWVGAES